MRIPGLGGKMLSSGSDDVYSEDASAVERQMASRRA